MKSLVTLLIVLASASAAAQATKTPPKPDSSKAPATKAAGTKAADTKQAQGTKAPAPGTKAPTASNTKQAAPAGAPAAATIQTPTIMREVYSYDVEGRRDPFVSLLSSSTLRPTVADLYLTSILYDENGSNSIAMMRDATDGNKQYRVTTGQTIGRMKVALIKRRVVIFSIEEFGLNRQDSLILGDTTKARAK